MVGNSSKNLFNSSTVTNGYFADYYSGNLAANSSYSASDFIPVSPSTAYARSINGVVHADQVAFYDIGKNYTSGLPSASSFTTPSTAAFIRISIATVDVGLTQIEAGTAPTSFVLYGTTIKPSQVSNNTTTITVKSDGTGNFTNLSAAIASISNSGSNNIYNINIYEGTYDVYATLTAAEKSGAGIVLPDYVNLIGIGEADKIIIKMDLTTTTLDESTRLSPLNVKLNNILTNLTVTAHNCRYAVHSDNGNSVYNYTINAANCTFIHYGNDAGLWTICNVWGEGSASGSKFYFKNSTFIAYAAQSMGIHNNTNFIDADYHEFDNCRFSDLTGNDSIAINSIGSGKVGKIIFKGCKFSGPIAMTETPSHTIEYQIEGYGNEPVPLNNNATDIQETMNFSDEIAIKKNVGATTITKGTLLKYSGVASVQPLLSTDPLSLFAGIAWKDCIVGSECTVKRKGYIGISEVGLSGISTGVYIGIVSGTLATVATKGDAIAVAVNNTWMKLL
jgi:hypothetical protein